MTRDEALLKLIAVEPITYTELLVVTGWPTAETLASAHRLQAQGAISKAAGHYCLPEVALALQEAQPACERARAPVLAESPANPLFTAWMPA